jgi:hypothetical protein
MSTTKGCPEAVRKNSSLAASILSPHGVTAFSGEPSRRRAGLSAPRTFTNRLRTTKAYQQLISETTPPATIASTSVLVCTHNPRQDYLDRCIEGLKQQTLARDKWELVIVDNASAADKIPSLDLSWHPGARLVYEKQHGLTSARLRGIRETVGDLLVFVDDDNVLDADFLANARAVAEEKTFLGSWSGQCRPEFEQPPPEWTRRYWGNLVIREFDQDVWSNLPRLPESMPCGAGLCVRRNVAQRYLFLHESGKRTIQLDRSPNSLLSGGDNDLAACACDLGLGAGLIASLKLTHLVPPERLTEEYLSRLAEGIYFSSALLDRERGIPSVPRKPFAQIVDVIRVLQAKPPHRRILRAAYRGRDRALRKLQFQS